jgi:lipoate-protein ligase A
LTAAGEEHIDPTPLALRVDPPAAGDWNMAVDEMLLEAAAETGTATLRFYRWTPATLSLGYFQNAADRASHAASADCPVVRRASGGGALVHDAEVTYSLSLPTGHPLAADPETLYRRVHGSLVRLLGDLGFAAQLNERTVVPLGREPFLCFERRATGDVLVGVHKICGSAQRRRRGAILQHGGVLLGRSTAAPGLPGLAELPRAAAEGAGATDVSSEFDARGFTLAWIERFRTDIHPCRPAAPYAGAELARIEHFRRTKYADDSWTNRR